VKRDLDLIRCILLLIEQDTGDLRPWINIEVEGRSRAIIVHHVRLMHEAGLIEALIPAHVVSGEDNERPHHLTWVGYEFLDLARHDMVWEEAKSRAEQGGAYNFELLKELLAQIAREQLKLPPDAVVRMQIPERA
jgi:hypothetical protein